MEVRYFHYQERNCAQQRNFAIERAKHDNLLLIDDDVEVDPHWVEELFKPIWSDPEVGATMGKPGQSADGYADVVLANLPDGHAWQSQRF